MEKSFGMSKADFTVSLEKYNTDKVKICDSESELINYAYKNFVNNHKGIIVAYSGRLNDKGYKDITNEDLTSIVQKVISIDHNNTLEDGISLWGNIASINKGMMKLDNYTLLCVSINYRNTKEEIYKLNNYYKNCIQLIYEGKNINLLSDFEKTKLVHDYICENFDYDLSYTNYDDYSAVFLPIDNKNVMVCQGYCLMAYKLLHLSGIESKILISDDESHSWNLVKINNLWYKMDVTNDDTGYFNGIYDYKYFLRADLKGKSNYVPATSCLLYKDISNLNYSLLDYNDSLWNIYNINSHLYFFIFRILLSKSSFLYIVWTVLLIIFTLFLFKWINKRAKHQKEKKNKKYEEYNSI